MDRPVDRSTGLAGVIGPIQRTYKRLTAAQVGKLVAAGVPGMFAHGDGLYLRISKARVPPWSFRFMIGGRAREAGLGPARDVSLAQARSLAYEMRQQKRDGVDPLEAKRAKRQGAATARAALGSSTFRSRRGRPSSETSAAVRENAPHSGHGTTRSGSAYADSLPQ